MFRWGIIFLVIALIAAALGFLITIETQPASTGVVALEPFDSRS
ncbi:hypothetical protein [Enterobacter kobei]|nr:hypothetical protein [Enterobacter kobei]